MPKLRLVADELQVTSFHAEPAAEEVGTVLAHQTEPVSDVPGCTQTHCTYPIWLCKPRKEGEAEPERKPANG